MRLEWLSHIMDLMLPRRSYCINILAPPFLLFSYSLQFSYLRLGECLVREKAPSVKHTSYLGVLR